MSKIINLSPEIIEDAKKELGEQLAGTKLTDGKISWSKTLPGFDDKAVLYFTQTAWVKMTALLKEFTKEVAWHGVARRVEDEDNAYEISDIMVYPQTVGPADVDMDPEEYTKWLIAHDGDERFDHIRFQGHSHVDMPPSPSGTDMDHQREILDQLGPDDFYIFAIYNKSLRYDIRIYDFQKNRMFGNADVTVKIIWDLLDLDSFMAESKAVVKERPYAYQGGNSHTYNPMYTTGDKRPVTPGGTGKALSSVEEPNKNKPVTKPGTGDWNVPQQAGFDDDDGPYPAQK